MIFRHFDTLVVSTSKTGPNADIESVVDWLLRVKDIEGLREIDAGVMPKIVSVYTNAGMFMIAECGEILAKKIGITLR